MDTRNDGSNGTFKTVLSLRNVTHTGPWTWHGWQQDLRKAMKKSIVDTMLGKEPTEDDVSAMIACFQTLKTPPRVLTAIRTAALPKRPVPRRKGVSKRAKANCAHCLSCAYFTDGKIHDVGTGEKRDKYKGYNPPSLLGIYDRILYLHDGRCGTLEQVLRGPTIPDIVTGRGPLTEAELQDLIAYVKSL